MGDVEAKDEQTLKQKLLFYTTAFFVLLGTFSLFAFLFLVPFVIDPAFTTIFMEFDPIAALCVTIDTEYRRGASNCSWTSCREGCTKEIYECRQIRVNYKLLTDQAETVEDGVVENEGDSGVARVERAIREYDYSEDDAFRDGDVDVEIDLGGSDTLAVDVEPTGLMGNDSEWYFTRAKLLPNVKGCVYPPIDNCTIFYNKYNDIGTNFSCYYSKIDPGIVISELDMRQVYMSLVYAMAIPIPSFICSIIYLTIAYFKIYNEDEEAAPLEQNAEDMDVDVEGGDEDGEIVDTVVPGMEGATPTPGSEAFREDLASFGHQLEVQMADEMSRESIVDAVPG